MLVVTWQVHKFCTWQILQAVIGSFTRSSETARKKPNRLSDTWLQKILLLFEIETLNFQIQDLGIASLSCLISPCYASITALCAAAAKLVVAICCSCSYTSVSTARPRQGGSKNCEAQTQLLLSHTAWGPAGPTERNQCPLEPKCRARVGTPSSAASGPVVGCGSFGDKGIRMKASLPSFFPAFLPPSLPRVALLVASSVLIISGTGTTPHCHSPPSCTWLWTELKKILLRLPLQSCHHNPLPPTWGSISQLSALVSDLCVPSLPAPSTSQAEKV